MYYVLCTDMGHVQDRWYRDSTSPETGKVVRERTTLFGTGQRYRVRYLDPEGRERSKSFPDKCKREAEIFLVEVESKKRAGSYIDPAAGELTFRDQGENWIKGQSPDRATRMILESRLRSRIYPYFGGRPVKSITSASIRDWLGVLDDAKYSQNYRAVLFTIVSSIFDSAVDDRLIDRNPCKARSIKRPTSPQSNIVVWPEERFFAVRRGLHTRFKILATLGAGCGLRQGELLAVSPDDLDSDAEVLHVQRQIRMIDRQLVFALPKGGKTRRVPLPTSVAAAVSVHLEQFPAASVSLPWTEPDGRLTAVALLATGENGRLYSGDLFSKTVWHNAFRKSGLERHPRADGMHALRHFYASSLLANGVSVKELAEYLGHADPGFTLRTYTHLVPSSFQRARAAIDGILAPDSALDGLGTA